MPTITVTQDDITLGKPGDTKTCPVARAAARALAKRGHSSFSVQASREQNDVATEKDECPLFDDISVGGFQIVYWPDPDTAEIYNLPGCAQAWIAAFDQGVAVRPITFDVERRVEG
jgi:hypothetical protein